MPIPPPPSTHFPYTTLFRSAVRICEPPLHDIGVVGHGMSDNDVLLVEDDDQFFCPDIVGASERPRSEEHTSELQSRRELVCRPLLEKKNNIIQLTLASHDPT